MIIKHLQDWHNFRNHQGVHKINIIGLSTEHDDEHPIPVVDESGFPIAIGSTFNEIDTGIIYKFFNNKWNISGKKEPKFKFSDEPFPENPEKNDLVFEMDTAKLYYWSGTDWLEVGWNSEPQPTFPEIFSCHVVLSSDTEILEEQDIDFNDTLITITATQPGVTKCILNNFVTYPEGVQVYHNGEVVQWVEFEDNIELTANEETSYAINLVKEV